MGDLLVRPGDRTLDDRRPMHQSLYEKVCFFQENWGEEMGERLDFPSLNGDLVPPEILYWASWERLGRDNSAT